MFSVKCLKTGEIISNDGSGTIHTEGCTLVVGFDGKIYDIQEYSYDDGGGAYIIDVSSDYELIIDASKEKQR